jgi:hypothetical protein
LNSLRLPRPMSPANTKPGFSRQPATTPRSGTEPTCQRARRHPPCHRASGRPAITLGQSPQVHVPARSDLAGARFQPPARPAVEHERRRPSADRASDPFAPGCPSPKLPTWNRRRCAPNASIRNPARRSCSQPGQPTSNPRGRSSAGRKCRPRNPPPPWPGPVDASTLFTPRKSPKRRRHQSAPAPCRTSD